MTDMQLDGASEPPWLALARRELGVTEGTGSSDNSRVLAYYRDAGHPDVSHDSVAWCAAFASAIIERAGLASPRTLMARDFLRWGTPLDQPRPGCIAVLWRGQPDSSEGHVGFFTGTSGNRILILGGNQGDKVSIAAFPQEQVLGYRWPSPGSSSAQSGQDAIFEAALAHILTMEGGWTDDPFDPGGPTNKGITLAEFARWQGVALTSATLPDLRERLRAIDMLTLRRIYQANYWQPARCADLPPAIAFVHFDAAVNQGLGRAIRFLQTALSMDVDGEIGPLTLAAASHADPSEIVATYSELRRSHYRSLQQFWRFGRGWLNRVDATQSAALQLAARSVSPGTAARKEVPPMTDTTQSSSSPPKWWGHSMTIWGVVLTGMTTVLPIVARAAGIDLPAQLLQDLGTQIASVLQAIAGLSGIVVTILGRVRATQPLVLSSSPPLPSPPTLRVRDWKREG